MRKRLLLLVLATLFNLGSANAEDPSAWFLEHVHYLTTEGGYWTTSNTEYQSEEDPFSDYVMEWRVGIGGNSINGEMYGLLEGQTFGPIWEFKTVWHPGEKRVLAYQFGRDGTFGVGPMISVGDGTHRIEQEFFVPSGGSFKAGHEGSISESEFRTQTFDIGADGSWTRRRFYVWKRATPAP